MKIFPIALLFFLIACKPSVDRNIFAFTGLLINRNSATSATNTAPQSTTPIQTTTSIVSNPTFNIAPGFYNNAQTITISTITSGATIYYTLDGTTPTISSNQYSSSFSIWSIAGRTIKAYAVKSGSAGSGILTGTFSYPPLKTSETSSQVTGDDGYFQYGIAKSYSAPTQDSTYTNDYTTLDNSTGLIWKTCPQGKSGSTCALGSIQSLVNDGTANDATNHAIYGCNALNSANSGNGYANLKNWRLPTIQELATIVHIGVSNPSTTMAAFPGTANNNYWSMTIDQTNTAKAWTINFSNGDIDSAMRNTSYNFQCVASQNISEFHSYTDNGDGTVKDNGTGLVWQKCGVGQTNDATCSGGAGQNTWVTMINYCNSLSLASKTWRLPNRNEIFSITDFTKSTSPTLDSSFFPSNPVATYHWSSSSYAPTIANAWGMLFSNADLIFDTKTNSGHVRCVTGP